MAERDSTIMGKRTPASYIGVLIAWARPEGTPVAYTVAGSANGKRTPLPTPRIADSEGEGGEGLQVLKYTLAYSANGKSTPAT